MKKAVATPTKSPIVIIYGMDDKRNFRIGYFAEADKEAARKAAESMNMNVLLTDANELGSAFKLIPAGNLSQSGYEFTKRVRSTEYYAVAAVIAALRPSADISRKGCLFPTSWDDIKKDSFVIAQADTADYGWWPAVVEKVEGAMLTLRWQHYPKEPPVKRHKNSVALVRSI